MASTYSLRLAGGSGAITATVERNSMFMGLLCETRSARVAEPAWIVDRAGPNATRGLERGGVRP
jgi:hypothetical protein